MSRPSSVDKLPDEIKAEIGRLRGNGHTIDEIMAALRQLDVSEISRSALGRHIKGMEVIGQRLRRSRDVAEALVSKLGDQSASKTAQLNIQLVHSAMFDLFMGMDGEIAEGGQAALAGDPQGIMMLAKALDHLTRSSKSDADFVKQVEDRAAAKAVKEASARVETISRERGLSAETIAAIKVGIVGLPSGKPA